MTRRRALGTAAVWLVLSILLAIGGTRPAVVVIAGIVAAVAALMFVMVDLSHAVTSHDWHRRARGPRFEPGSDRWGLKVRQQLNRAERFGSTELSDVLVRVVDDRLLAHHSIDRAHDEAAAHRALTPGLRRLVDETPYRITGLRDLDRLVTDIEAL
jgi:hypothetical protein